MPDFVEIVVVDQENASLATFFLAAFAESVGFSSPSIYEPAGATLSNTDIDALTNHFVWTTPSAVVLEKFRNMVGDASVVDFLIGDDPFTKIQWYTPWRHALATLLKVFAISGRLYYEILAPPPGLEDMPDLTHFYLTPNPVGLGLPFPLHYGIDDSSEDESDSSEA